MNIYEGNIMRKNAQAHVIEMIAAVILFVGVLLFISSFSTGPPQQDYSVVQLKTLGDDSLRMLDNIPINNQSDAGKYHNSTLVKYIATNDAHALADFLNLSLPETVSYNVYLRTVSERKPFYYMGALAGETGVAHRIIVYDGNVYDVELVMWYEPRSS